MITEERFELTEAHIKLLKNMVVGWQHCETGAPEIDPKRPYGDSNVALNVAEILDIPIEYDGDPDYGELDERFREQMLGVHATMQYAVEIALQHVDSVVVPGTYVKPMYSSKPWKLVLE